MNSNFILISYIVSAILFILGIKRLGKVPPQLHTPLMSGSNAISGITIVGALLAVGASGDGTLLAILGFCAIVFGTINVVGGYLVTDRMLKMFRKK